MPRWIYLTAFILAPIAVAPFLFIAKARQVKSPRPRIHIIQDMANQPRFKEQMVNLLFRDTRAMRPPVPGTVPTGPLRTGDPFYTGKAGSEWVTAFPIPIDSATMKRGQDRFEIYCSPCHGLDGYGDGIINKRADALQEGTWVPAVSYHSELIRQRPVGHLFNTITNGIRTMPAYGPQIPEADRWAIVAYVRALQLSQNAPVSDVPPDVRPSLR